ncbi:MAG TPA: hypothetical protein VMD78_15095 [Candidatus Baltobacteraceae bacterium]|nr:hypothetical protein [Candidatus Baltobacteraceae bacterium]
MNTKQFVGNFRSGGELWGGRFAGVATLVVLGLLFSASGAKAGCAMPYQPGAAPFVTPHALDDSGHGDWDGATIVGLWHLNYTATYDNNFPPGNAVAPPFPFLESYKTWHADGTEFENAFLPPAGGNICFGVWKDLGHGSVKLHHIGLMFDSTGAVSAVFTVDEIDTVSPSGKTYSGSFDFKLFGPTDVYGTGTPISEVKGTTSGTRIGVD